MYLSKSRFAVLLSGIFSTGLHADEIRLFTWEDNFSPEVISEFESTTDHTVKQIYFESEMLRDAVVHSGKASAYDLFILDSHSLGEFADKGVLSKIDPKLLDAAGPFSMDSAKACGQFGIPYAYGTIGIGYRSSKVSTAFTSWMDVFEYAKHSPGKLVIPDEDVDTIAVALMALGYHPMSSDKSELTEAYQLLNRTFDSLLAFRNSAAYAFEKEHNSEMDVAVFYSGEKESIANVTGQEDWEYVIPNDGTLVWYECLSSHADKPMSKATQEFVRFLNLPHIAAKNAEDVWFATSNQSALSQASAEYLGDSELFPEDLPSKNIFQYEGLDDASLILRARIISTLMDKQ